MLAQRGVFVASFDKDCYANRELEQAHKGICGIDCDCEDMAQIREGFDRAMEQFGKVDILVNNAGNFFAFQLYKGFL